MRRATPIPFVRLTVVLLAVGLVGCNAFGLTGDDDDDNEVRVTVTAVAATYLDANDGIRYEVTENTEYEGYESLAGVAVGDIVEIEFEEIADSDNRRALEIEADGADDD